MKQTYESKVRIRPVLTWAGGKSRLVKWIDDNLPMEIKKGKRIEVYCETFLGGGALFFYLASKYDIGQSILIDKDEDLMNFYNVLARDFDGLVRRFNEVIDIYKVTQDKEKKKLYGLIRAKFNSIDRTDSLERAVYYFFLNKRSYGGLMTNNKDGFLNPRFDGKIDKGFYEYTNLHNASRALSESILITGDYALYTESTAKQAKKRLIYCDPPYLVAKGNSQHYNHPFNEEEEDRFQGWFKELSSKDHVYAIQSNRGNYYEQRERFRGFSMEVKRFRNGINNGEMDESLIKNYNH